MVKVLNAFINFHYSPSKSQDLFDLTYMLGDKNSSGLYIIFSIDLQIASRGPYFFDNYPRKNI